MPAIFAQRTSRIDSGANTLTSQMSFAFKIKPSTSEEPSFFSIGYPVIQGVTNEGDYVFTYEIVDAETARLDVTVVHASETFCIWRHDIPRNTDSIHLLSADVDITGTTRSASDVTVYYDGQPVNQSGAINMGTATPPASMSGTWSIGGTADSSSTAINGLYGEIGDVVIFNRLLSAAEHGIIHRIRNPHVLTGCVLHAPLRQSLTDFANNRVMTWSEGENTLSGGPLRPHFSESVRAQRTNRSIFLDLIDPAAVTPPTPPGSGSSAHVGTYIQNFAGTKVGTYI